ncbi:MAG: sugar transferase [Nitrospinaceae bacterium]|nr:sugar transferase [Nitrospinaceae bacterium]NIR56266.1 sugar transferase [Nitrospinaceae bacterium]NIS86722.1 sugar transferase [Nitrospinaceae bacterium]NIT83555.1 sugar transferase [Nitrospinaceae bacterium]NIU45760.1 sugar transferase [Nitrospinaceae bacterium]
MPRWTHICLALLLLPIFLIPMVFIALGVKITSPGPAIHWSTRIGRNNTLFQMPKFRTMRTDAPDVATHLLTDSAQYVTPLGGFLRKTSLDELPQLWSIIKGDMVFVGPRPALHNQDDLARLRTQAGVHLLYPGITGWAQINGRDELSIPDKVALECYYLKHRSISLDIQILARTVLTLFTRKDISH